MNGDRSMPRVRAAALTACVAALALLAAGAGAQAATVTLRCAGPGPRNADSAGTVLCAGTPAHGRTLAGVVRDDAGRPVAARLAVTYSSWIPLGNDSFSIEQRAVREIVAKADGTFAIEDNPATKESIRVDVEADATLGVSGASASADVSRRLVVKLAKLGGGRVRFTVSGTTHRPLKVWVLDSYGYPVSGGRGRKLNGRGQATFDLSRVPRGARLAYYVDAGAFNDLFWDASRVPFRL